MQETAVPAGIGVSIRSLFHPYDDGQNNRFTPDESIPRKCAYARLPTEVRLIIHTDAELT